MECQLVVDIRAEVSSYTKLITDLLKLKPKADKTITVVAIDGVKQTSLRNVKMVIIKVMN